MRSEADFVVVSYRRQPAGGEWRDEEYRVRIVRTACNLGGSRPWFGCRRRVAILYGGGIFACRHSHQLAYASACEDASDRAARKVDRLRERFDWEPVFPTVAAPSGDGCDGGRSGGSLASMTG